MSSSAMLEALGLFPLTAAVTARGHLSIGGCDAVDLAREYGTPLYVFDVATIRQQCQEHRRAFASRYPAVDVLYAGKAYLGVGLARLIRDEGLGLDVVSGGEMHIAKVAGFPAQRVCFHGNNKSAEELGIALDWGIGRIAVDNLHELGMLATLARQRGIVAPILLRLAPAVDPHTHRYVATGVADSKFGLPIVGGMAAQAVASALGSTSLRLHGYHVHIGSQVRDLDAYRQTVEVVAAFAAAMSARHGFVPAEIGLGGGWAVRYTLDDAAPTTDEVAQALASSLRGACQRFGLPLPRLVVEPGRALVAQAGVALYTVGGSKEIAGMRRYVFIDGGMADNIRPALYGACYTALLANRASDEPTELATIAGRYCESGDVLIADALLPTLVAGDILAVAMCGAYAIPLASNYNLALRPAIVAVENGQVTLWRRREVYDDLLRCEGM